ncbi:MAG: xylulokinase [Anaerolineae bacterium]|nr:xylulokinase [Anaerolineae bacterium]
MMALLGIDLGTSGVKALLMDEAGNALATATVEYPLYTPKPLWSEQDPADWWRGTVEAIQVVLSKANIKGSEVSGIGLSGQMHGLTPLDKDGNVIRRAILWNDGRTSAECDEYVGRAGGEARVRELVYNLPSPSYTAPKVLWMRNHEPENYAKLAHILLPKDYIRFKLSGEYATDVSDATGTGLLDTKRRIWSDEMLSALQIDKALMPRLGEGHEVTSHVSAAAASETGLAAGTPIASGAGDQAASAVGAGVVQEGIVSVTIGTSGVVFASTDTMPVPGAPGVSPLLEVFCHALPNTWHYMGVMLSAGGSLRWFRDNIAYGHSSLVSALPPRHSSLQSDRDPYDVMLAQANEIVPGAEGLVFLPYLSGERTPHRDPLARGAFVGLTLRHTQAHMTRAVVEAISFGLRDSLELVRQSGVNVSEVRAAGGGARSPIWRQWLADIFDAEITLINSSEGGAMGVALLAGVGTGVWRTTHEACAALLRVTSRTEPTNTASVRRAYDEAYGQFKALFPSLREHFHALAKLG